MAQASGIASGKQEIGSNLAASF